MEIGDLRRVCVVGAGAMGRQIALNTALHGYDVTIRDADPGQLAAAAAGAVLASNSSTIVSALVANAAGRPAQVANLRYHLLDEGYAIDVAYLVREQRYPETDDPAQRPPRSIAERYRAGHHGRKTGRGFYAYGGESQ